MQNALPRQCCPCAVALASPCSLHYPLGRVAGHPQGPTMPPVHSRLRQLYIPYIIAPRTDARVLASDLPVPSGGRSLAIFFGVSRRSYLWQEKSYPQGAPIADAGPTSRPCSSLWTVRLGTYSGTMPGQEKRRGALSRACCLSIAPGRKNGSAWRRSRPWRRRTRMARRSTGLTALQNDQAHSHGNRAAKPAADDADPHPSPRGRSLGVPNARTMSPRKGRSKDEVLTSDERTVTV